MRLIFTFIAMLSLGSLQAQFLEKLAVSAEYRYLGRNVLGLGVEYRLSHHEAPAFNVGAKTFYTKVENKSKVLPQFNIEYGWGLNGILMSGVSVTPYAIEPQLQLSFLNMISLNVGYAVPIHSQKYFKGVTFGIQINVGVKGGKYYNYLKIGF